jgi:hypothetical protein
MNYGATTAALLAMLGLGAGCDRPPQSSNTGVEVAHRATHPALLHGRVTTVDGETYRGRLRFGGGEEAFWGDYFNGRKDENPWIAHLPARARPRAGISFIGIRIGGNMGSFHRPFMARMGDITKLEARGRDLWATMKSGTVHHLDRYAADDFADGVRIWDPARGVVDLNERQVRTIEFEPPPRAAFEPPYRLHGSVHTAHGTFTGFIQWGRRDGLAMDALVGSTADGESVSVPFATVRSISHLSDESALVTLLDGRELVLSDDRHVSAVNRGVYVDDVRYGRVLVSWDVLERADFTPVGAATDSGPSYDDFPAGRPLVGTVTTRAGVRHVGRIVFDLDESEDTETLDAPSHGVDYTLPFALVESITLPGGGDRTGGRAEVMLRSGERLQLERAGDLGRANGGLLIFPAGDDRAEYVPWRDVVRIDFGTREVR